MATFNFSGAISGLDTASMITAIMNAERLPADAPPERAHRAQDQADVVRRPARPPGEARVGGEGVHEGLRRRQADRDLVGGRPRHGQRHRQRPRLRRTRSTVNHLATSTRAQSTARHRPRDHRRRPRYEPRGPAAARAPSRPARSAWSSTARSSAPRSARRRRRRFGDALTAIGDALTAQVQANEGAGSTATVTASVVDNRLQLSLPARRRPTTSPSASAATRRTRWASSA